MRHFLPIAALVAATFATLPACAEDGEIDSAKVQAFNQRLFNGPAVDKASACFERRYDKSHLAAHPKQRVAEMRLLVAAETAPEETRLDYAFNIGLNYRARKTLYLSMGSCSHSLKQDGSGDVQFGCGVDCDGGGMAMALAQDGQSVTVTVDQRLRIWRKGTVGDDTTPDLEPGADDKSFRLQRVELKRCAGLIEQGMVAASEK